MNIGDRLAKYLEIGPLTNVLASAKSAMPGRIAQTSFIVGSPSSLDQIDRDRWNEGGEKSRWEVFSIVHASERLFCFILSFPLRKGNY